MLYRALLAAGLALGAGTAFADPPASRKVADPVVYLDMVNKGKPVGHCSGVVAHVGHAEVIVTAGHCVAAVPKGHIYAVDSFGRRYDLPRGAIAPASDIAVLAVPDDKPPSASVKLACSDPMKIGEGLHTTAFPLSLGRVSVSGRLASEPQQVGPWASVYVADMRVAQGDSGGAVLNDAGEDVGVVVGLTPQFPGIAFVVPAETLCAMGVV